VEIRVKYEGYLAREREAAEKTRSLDAPIPSGFAYRGLAGLSTEVVQKHEKLKPDSLAQAARISGVTPAAVDIRSVHLRKHACTTAASPDS
jgi:tRNA uridine 5-carboxymethylaminomethyl modification enzyme